MGIGWGAGTGCTVITNALSQVWTRKKKQLSPPRLKEI